jgi:hypothetical protein
MKPRIDLTDDHWPHTTSTREPGRRYVLWIQDNDIENKQEHVANVEQPVADLIDALYEELKRERTNRLGNASRVV